MVSPLEIEKRNLESSLLFMQQEHSGTLKALHEEISKLQRRCKELTFELTMQDYTSDEAEKQGEEDRVNQLEALVKENEEKHNQLERELQKKDKNVTDLKRQLRKTEKSFVEELKKRDQQVLALKMDLDSKSSTIAYLTTEMHKFKLTHLSTTKQTKDMTDRLQSPTMTDRNEKLESHRIVSAKDIRSRPVTSKSTKRRPDAEVFLAHAVQQDTEAESVAVKPIPPVLPPIVGGDELNKKVFSRRQQLIRRRLDLKSQPEYSKLAVDKIASTANTWVHEPKTTTE